MMKKAFTPLERKRNSKDNCSSLTGFTLLELVVVIIILGVLATLGFTQYGRMIEKARANEARQILGDMRKLVYAYWLENGTLSGITNANVNIGTAEDQIPSTCRSSHYFSYTLTTLNPPNEVSVSAFRCGANGKPPQGNPECWVELDLDFATPSAERSFHGTCGY